MNPECLILHKPTLAFDDSEKTVVINLLKWHVEQRGLQLPEEGRKLRRRRTVFLSSSQLEVIKNADCIYEVSIEGGVQAIDLEEAIRGLDNWAVPVRRSTTDLTFS